MVKTAIDVARSWLRSAEVNFEAEEYEQSLYSMEMSVEIAFKAVLTAVNVEVPKVHDIADLAMAYLGANKKLPADLINGLESYLTTFNLLLDFRPIVGYGFEEKFRNKDFKTWAKELLPESKRIVSACAKAVREIGD